MPIRFQTLALFMVAVASASAVERAAFAQTYKGLKYSPAPASGTWAILDRDGANRPVARYLSSLGGGETGTGVIVSPAFVIASDKIVFTICGHDGPSGGQGKNFIALIDSRKGATLQKTFAPGNDAMQERSWDVAKLRGREVRIEIHDGDPGTGFAWLGVGRIDAGDPLRVDFRDGLPKDWNTILDPVQSRPEILRNGVPFLRHASQYSLAPASGKREIACGFAAERIFFLGGTVAYGRPLETVGFIDLEYRDGSRDSIPLMVGFTLDIAGKQLSRSKAIHLHPSADPFQHYLVVAPRPGEIEKIVLRASAEAASTPRITAITFQTQATGDQLEPLPDAKPAVEEEAWIRSHVITARSLDMERIVAEIRQAHKMQ